MANNNVEFVIELRDQASGALRTVTVSAENAEAAIGRIVATAQRAGDRMRGMAATAIMIDSGTRALQNLQGLIGGVAAQYNSFDGAMRQANTMAQTSGKEFDALKNHVSALGKEIPKTRAELADGLYQVISNGVPKDNWISFLEQSARASTGGVADLGQTVTVTSTIIKNYGLAWNAAGSIQDKIQTTAKNGVTSFEQLGQALPRVTGSAAQLGVEIDELMATFATATGVTGNTAEVSTQLGAILNSLIKPTSEASAAADAMGIRFDAASIKAAGGFQAFLTQLDKHVQDYAASSGQLSQTIYGQLFGSAEALRLLGSLTGEQKETFANNITAMADSTGAIADAFGEVAGSGDSAMQLLQNKIAALTDKVGAIASLAAPYLSVAANAGIAAGSIAQLITFVNGLNLASKAAAAGQAIATAATKAWSVAQMALNAVMSANPIAIVVLAVAALVAGIVYAYNHCEEFRQICDKVWTVIKQVASAIWASLVKAFEAVSGAVKKAWEWVKRFLGLGSDSSDTLADGMQQVADSANNAAGAGKKAAEGSLKAADAIDHQRMSYEQLGKAIESQKVKVAQLAGTNAANAKAEADRLRHMQQRYKMLGKQYGLSDSGNSLDGSALVRDARSYKELANNIQYYETRLQKLDPAETSELRRISQTIAALKQKQSAIKALQESYAVPAELRSIADVEAAISAKKAEIAVAIDNKSRIRLQHEIEELERRKIRMEIIMEAKPVKADEIVPDVKGFKLDLSKIGVKLPDLKSKVKGLDLRKEGVYVNSYSQGLKNMQQTISNTQGALGGISNMLGTVAKMTGESTGAWLQWGAQVLSACSRAVPAIMAVTCAKAAESAAATPIIGWIAAGAAIAGVIAAFSSIPKFASGGIAYGPTLGLFGEYAGAGSNPEVVAPLDRLRSLIEPQGGGGGSIPEVIYVRARGRDLEAVVNTRAHYRARTR